MSRTFLGMPTATERGTLRGRDPFPVNARAALADAQLRRNLRHATTTIRDKRALVVQEVPDWEALRDTGSAVKADVMARLPELLAQLEQNVVARGGVVHWARDADEANAIVRRVVQDAGARFGEPVRQVVKVKSMATQEIDLNAALEAGGVQPVETDLAELIVQLADDRPSHILVPAIHRNRSEIRQIFLDHMPGAPADLTDEPRVLAMAAREHLRRTFLSARVAVSGANFAVADTGTLAVVESEGNGRMCLTLPDVLVTVMGIEKLVPTWQDLEVFLQLLPRSSTGERMNPYTSLWTGVTPGDGPQEFHLVLLDNGRTAALADDVGRAALHCIRCSACLNVCPVYERAGGHAYGSVYPGPIGAVLTPQLTGMAGHGDVSESLPYASSLCGACYDVCPVKIDIPSLLVRLRARHVETAAVTSRVPTPEAAAMATAAWVMSDARRFSLAEKGLRAGRLVARDGRISTLPPPLSAWTTSRDLAEPPAQTFRQWWASRRGVQTSGAPRHSAVRARARPEQAPGAAPDVTTTGAARDVVLARVERALAGAAAPGPVPREYRRAATAAGAGLLDLLTDRLVDYKADVRAVDAAGLPAALAEVLAGVARVVVPPDVTRLLDGATGPQVLTDTADAPLSTGDLDAVDAVVTGCALAVAETGTIVLDGSPACGRRAITLVPDRHVVVVHAGQVVRGVPEAVGRLDPTRPQTWVSGPSATSDIELSRVEGVHGPRTLVVLLVTG